MVTFFQYIFHTPVKIQNRSKMKHSFVRYIHCVHIANQKVGQIQAYHRKKVLRFHCTTVLLFTAKNICHTRLQTRVIRVVLSRLLYLIGNWSSDPKPMKEILAILKSALKLLNISFQYG